jgi:hypothetical protein
MKKKKTNYFKKATEFLNLLLPLVMLIKEFASIIF